SVTWCLEVLSIEGPSVIVNGSVPLVVLDCDYDLASEQDKKGFVLKWYYNRQPFPVYQWIPPNEPQDLRLLKGRLDKQYAVSDDEYKKHRALAIRNPTTDLSGEYTCWISSFESEDFKRKSIIVYSPVTEMSLTWSRLASGIIMINCNAGGIFPEPEVSIIRSGATDPQTDAITSERLVLEGVNVQTVKFAETSFYNVSAQLQIFDHDLSEETMFECIITIPKTEYQVREQMLYYPGLPSMRSSVSSGESLLIYTPLLIAAAGFNQFF
ncbi:unnamed protein product, partial [Meganyctiphanes norvegica]